MIHALQRAVEAVPGDAASRLHWADTLLAAGHSEGAAAECATAKQRDPSGPDAGR